MFNNFFCELKINVEVATPTFIIEPVFSLGMVVAFILGGLLPTVTLSLEMAVQRMVQYINSITL